MHIFDRLLSRSGLLLLKPRLNLPTESISSHGIISSATSYAHLHTRRLPLANTYPPNRLPGSHQNRLQKLAPNRYYHQYQYSTQTKPNMAGQTATTTDKLQQQQQQQPENNNTNKQEQEQEHERSHEHEPLALPSTDSSDTTKLDISSGSSTTKLDHLGPLVINQDGTLSRITNWPEMTEIERRNTLRVLGKRNQLRTAKLKEGSSTPADSTGEKKGE